MLISTPEELPLPTIGSTYRTGQRAPVSGVFETVSHLDGTDLCGSHNRFYLGYWRTFPPHGEGCGKGALYRLVSYGQAFKVGR